MVVLTGGAVVPDGAHAAGPVPRRVDYSLSRWLVLRLLGVVYLIAFVSLGVQVIGLIGHEGLFPVGALLGRARAALGAEAFYFYPTLLWLGHGDAMLRFLCWGGAALSVLLIADVAPVPVLALLWLFYLSLTVAGQQFLSFQWDALLLEAGLVAIFYAPLRIWPRFATDRAPSPVIRWLLWLLLFKVIFLSGITKLLSADPTWRNLTALTYHYETQPLPTWIGWYASHLPVGLQKISVLGVYVSELLVPIAIVLPLRNPWPRRIGCLAIFAFQLLIAATGNYGFFNLLTATLAIALLDDDALRWLVPWTAAGAADGAEGHGGRVAEGRQKRAVNAGVGIAIGALSLVAFVHEMVATVPGANNWVVSFTTQVMDLVGPFRSVNGYGLFRVMTTERGEIAVEASADDSTWTPMDFRWKPGPVGRRPGFVEPHMPRLDWQMWFAALNPRSSSDLLGALVHRLLEGSPAVRGLMAPGAFSTAPPKYVRLVYYKYEFTTFAERRATGDWWKRTRLGELTRAFSLEDFAAAGTREP